MPSISGRRPNFLPPSDFSLFAAQLQHIARHTSEKVKSLDALLLRPIDRRIEKYPSVRTVSPGNAEPVSEPEAAPVPYWIEIQTDCSSCECSPFGFRIEQHRCAPPDVGSAMTPRKLHKSRGA
jgi:hypothetical protein